MHISQNAPPRALRGHTVANTGRTRDELEAEFMRLYALRDSISSTLWRMTRILNRLDARKAGGANG